MHCQTVPSQSPSEGGVVNPNVLLLPLGALGSRSCGGALSLASGGG